MVWYLFTVIPPETLLDYFKNANYWWIALGLFFGVLSHLSRAYRWKFMLEPMGYKPKFTNSVLAVLIGYFVNLAIPRAGEVSRATVMANYENIPFEKGFGTIIAERVADLLVMLIIIGVTLFLQFDFIFNFLQSKFNLTSIILGLCGLFILGLFFISVIKKSQWPIALRIKAFLSGLVSGALSIFKMKKKWPFIFHTFFIWIMYVLMFYITSLAVPDLGEVTLGAVLIGFILASFSIAATNGGIGSFPVAVVTGFTLFGLPYNPSLAFGWIMWTSQTVMIIICGGLSLIILPLFNKKK